MPVCQSNAIPCWGKGRSHLLEVLCQPPAVHEWQHHCKQGELSAGAEQGILLLTPERVGSRAGPQHVASVSAVCQPNEAL